MTGWRIGFCVGNRNGVAALGKIKTNIDSGVFQAIQHAGVEALEHSDETPVKLSRVYLKRRDMVIKGLQMCGIRPFISKATFYVWSPVPEKEGSREFARRLLLNAGVVVTPGIGFGSHGEGYFRISLTAPEERLEEALHRIRKVADRMG